jgi:hypothetical protein
MSFRLLTAVAVAAALVPWEPATAESVSQERGRMTSGRAEGRFTVKVVPTPDHQSLAGFHRMLIEKQFAGGLAGSSRLEMLASNAGDQPAGGYVALERFSGSLDGRPGTFILQHSGTMAPGSMEIAVRITPGSGTGRLEGLTGSMTIRIEGKEHFYELAYTLPEP